jgi:ABC-type antimicrobial peptide transport system permease subunit
VLGAKAQDIQMLVMRDGLLPVATGLVVGLVAAWIMGRLFAGMLFQVKPTDPLTLIGVPLLLGAAAAVACYAPARRAANANPADSLHLE